MTEKRYEYGVTGKDRKALVEAISEILGTDHKYNGPPRYEFTIGDYVVDRDGTLIGPENISLIAWLADKGFELETETQLDADEAAAEIETASEPDETTAETETAPEPEEAAAEAETVLGLDQGTPKVEPNALEPNDTMPDVVVPTAPDADDGPDRLTIEYPLKNITGEVLANLRKMVAAKEPLLKQAFGAEELPILLTPDSIKFPWFHGPLDGDTVHAYAQFISCLVETAKKKKRVTAQPIVTDNPRFSMRVWSISLGMIGPEYGKIRRLLYQNLSGDSGWRYGSPKKSDKTAVEQNENSQPADDVNSD